MDTLREKMKKASNSEFRRCRVSRASRLRKIPNFSFSDLKIEAGAISENDHAHFLPADRKYEKGRRCLKKSVTARLWNQQRE